eukprot:788935-Pelagomonas_calceolata.AAC.1
MPYYDSSPCPPYRLSGRYTCITLSFPTDLSVMNYHDKLPNLCQSSPKGGPLRLAVMHMQQGQTARKNQ